MNRHYFHFDCNDDRYCLRHIERGTVWLRANSAVCVCVCAHRGLSNLVVLWTEAAQGVRLCYSITAQQLLPDVSPWRWCGTHAEHIWLGRVLPGSAWQQHHTALQTVTRRGQGLLCAQILPLTLNADLLPLLYSFF